MMKVKKNRSVIVGIFILLGIAILVVTIFTLGGQKKTFVKSFTVHAVFEDVNGLLKGANIWFSGVKVGTVKKIDFYGNSQVQVTMSIENDAQSHIRKGAMAKIASDGLIGSKIIVIYGGDSTAPEIAKEDFLLVEKASSTEDMLATLQKNNMNLLEITNGFKNISKKIDSGTGTIGTLLNDPALVNKLSATMENLQATTANFKVLSANSQHVIAGLQDFTGKLNKPGNAINDIVTDTAIYRNLQATMHQLEQASSSIHDLSNNLKATSDKLNEPDNMVGVLLNDKPSAAAVKLTLQNLQAASHKLDQDLEAVQHNFLLRGFFKKKAKDEKKNAPDTVFIN